MDRLARKTGEYHCTSKTFKKPGADSAHNTPFINKILPWGGPSLLCHIKVELTCSPHFCVFR